MYGSRPDDYTFEIVALIIMFFAVIGFGAIGYLIFSWIF